MDIKDTPWKCFVLCKNGCVYGLINEPRAMVGYQWLGNKGDGKFYVMSTHWEPKRYFDMTGPHDFTYDYAEAYRHMMEIGATRRLLERLLEK